MKYTCFIDPIDGTKEFASKRGQQCSTCIGFADEFGVSIAGIIYRPMTVIELNYNFTVSFSIG
jgi:fructose-1,6-bisphosphatase/inositol monophosphatase family enzyme